MTTSEILEKVSKGELTAEEGQKLLSPPKAPKKLSVKVSQKGAVAVYGLQRFPVTLYASQWERVFEFVPEIKKFIESNKGKLTTKDDSDAA